MNGFRNGQRSCPVFRKAQAAGDVKSPAKSCSNPLRQGMRKDIRQLCGRSPGIQRRVQNKSGMIFGKEGNALRYPVKVKTLSPYSLYTVNGEGEFTGAALMNGGVLLDDEWGDYESVQVWIKNF